MNAKQKPTGINEGIKKGISVDEFAGRVICKKCGKDVEFKKTVKLHMDCPRCKTPLERNINQEYKQSKKIITYDFFRRNRKNFLYLSLFLTAIAITFNVVGFFTQLFYNYGWWWALVTIPLVITSISLTHFPRLKSESKKHRILTWLLCVLFVVAISAIVITAVPYLSERLVDIYRV